MTINIDAIAEQYYAPYDPEFYQDTVVDAVTGETIDLEDKAAESWDGLYFTAETFAEFAEDHHDLLDAYLDDDDVLADYETNPAHMRELVRRTGRSLFKHNWRDAYV